MSADFNEEIEFRILEFVQNHYGFEVFTPGLDRTKPLYQPYLLEVQNRSIKTTIVAGTNGKGQTAHTLGHFLKNAGAQYALWTSPHILSIRERFSLNGEDVTYEELESEIQNAHKEIKNISGLKISFYEFFFLVFLKLALKRKIDHLLLEVGLGGRLDAVNHFDAEVACITSISRDHQSILGNRYDLILNEKIAVARPGKILMTQFALNYLNEATRRYCDNFGIQWINLQREELKETNYFEQNIAMASELFRVLMPGKFSPQTMSIPPFKGRREEMTFKGNTLIFIGAHNIDGVRSMTGLFHEEQKSEWPGHLLMSFSKRPPEEIVVMLKTINEHFGNQSKLELTTFDHPKAMNKSALIEIGTKINKGMLDFVTDWKTYLSQSSNQKILVCGSYYFVGEVQRFILSHH